MEEQNLAYRSRIKGSATHHRRICHLQNNLWSSSIYEIQLMLLLNYIFYLNKMVLSLVLCVQPDTTTEQKTSHPCLCGVWETIEKPAQLRTNRVPLWKLNCLICSRLYFETDNIFQMCFTVISSDSSSSSRVLCCDFTLLTNALESSKP